MIRSIIAVIALLIAAVTSGAEELEFTARSRYVREQVPGKDLIVCPRVERAPKLDGTIDDPLWKQAARTETAFTQLGKVEVVSRQTMVYLCRDETKLYVCFDCEEPEIEQQDIDGDIVAGDHIGLRIEQGDTRGRGQVLTILGNRAGKQMSGAWRGQDIDYVCKAGPKRWMAQMGIPFALFPLDRQPLRGEVWGLKLLRYGKGAGAGRLRASWPAIPVISEDVVLHNGRLFFEADDLLTNGRLAVSGTTVAGWTVADGNPSFAGGALACSAPVTFTQTVRLRPSEHASLDWTRGAWEGTARAIAGGTVFAETTLAAEHLDLPVPEKMQDVVVELRLRGSGPAAFHLSTLLDDVPASWICLTDNDWTAARDRSRRLPDSKPGAYTYLKNPGAEFGYAPYRSVGCSETDGSKPGFVPTKPPLDAPPPRPDVGEEESECFPLQVIYADAYGPPFADRVGLPLGSWDVGGFSGWIPCATGSLTGDPSWAGWPTDRWSCAVPHDLLFDIGDQYFIRRIDILTIKPCFRNLEVSVRQSAGPDELFTLVYRRNGSGTNVGNPWAAMPAYVSVSGIDSLARQVRISLGLTRPDNIVQATSPSDLMGIAEVWIWAEPRGSHKASDISYFKPYTPPDSPPRQALQLARLDRPVIWPRPKQLDESPGRFSFAPDPVIAVAQAGMLPGFAEHLRQELSRRLMVDSAVVAPAAVGERRAIRLGVAGIDADFDARCARSSSVPPPQPQGYALLISADGIILAGRDLEGLRNGLQSLSQWLEHDERNGFARCVRVIDWPRLTHRTALPLTDHRMPILPGWRSAWNYRTIVDGLERLRFNALEDFDPIDARFAGDSAPLVRYAAERGIELRPILTASSAQWPAECIEADPDNQQDGVPHITGSDGTWETANLCPSNPLTYAGIARYLDRVLMKRPNAGYVDLGLLGTRGGAWNTCPRCRARGLESGALYADFVNRIGQACSQRGLTPVITNAMMFDDKRIAPAFDSLNRAAVLRIDSNMSTPSVVVGGFWGLSRPWEAIWAHGAWRTYQGGDTFYQPLPPDTDAEGMLHIGEAADMWWWGTALGGAGLWAAEEFWNGPAPARGKDSDATCDRVAIEGANACVRLHEALDRGCEYPSWRTGCTPTFFNVDLRSVCTRSHIDEGSVSGLGRSGSREGALAMGSAFDLRRIPLGVSRYADVPFDIIDPEANRWKSMILIADAPKRTLIPGSVTRCEIPIGRTAASLCVLRMMMCATHVGGEWTMFQHYIMPAYSFVYDDGTRWVCDRELVRDYNWIDAQNFFYGNGLRFMYPNTIGGATADLFWPTRSALRTASLAGSPVDLYLSEFVNAYPAKVVRSLVIELPNPEQRNLTFGYHETVLAVTGVEPTEWDARWWSHQRPEPLLAAEPAVPTGAVRIDPATCRLDRLGVAPAWQLTLPAAAACSAVEFRLGLPVTNGATMQIRYGHRDAVVSVSDDGKTWTEVARIAGCTGMDGLHRVVFPSTKSGFVRVALDGSAYPDEDPTDVVILGIAAYAAGP